MAGYDLSILSLTLTNRLRNGENEIGNKKRINKAKLNYCFSEKTIARLMKEEEERKLGVARKERGSLKNQHYKYKGDVTGAKF